MKLSAAFILSLIFILSGCGEETAPSQNTESFTPDTIIVLPSDTIGILLGDTNYIFGTIGDVMFSSEGNIEVLDETACCVKVFDPSGEFILQMGREGSGPGEFLHPGGMVLLSDGATGVLDQPTGGFHRFNADGLFDSLAIDFQGQPVPQWAWGVDSEAFVGAYVNVDMVDDVLMSSYIVGRWEDSPEPAVIYYEHSFPFDPQDMTGFLTNTFLSTAYAGERDGTVYVASVSSDQYHIDILDAEGTLQSSISRDMPRIEKTPEELEDETALFRAILLERGVPEYMIDFQPDPYRWMIAPQGLGADGSERVWVVNAAADQHVIDVYSRDGEHLAIVRIEGVSDPDELEFINFKIQPQGILAYSMQDEEYPKVFVIPMPEIQ